MGIIQSEYLIVELWSLEDTKKIDKFISKLSKDMKGLFFKSVTPKNRYINYFMSWDGSKEGWDTSEEANKVRKRFIKLVRKEDKYTSILHIIPKGEIYDEDKIVRIG